MKKFSMSVKIKDLVRVKGLKEKTYHVAEILNDRKLVKLEGLRGSFQRSHVIIVRVPTFKA